MARLKGGLKKKTKAIFLDRDGVINEYVSELAKEKDFKLFHFTSSAIKKINNSEYLAIVITNQPMVAKGFLSEEELHQIHHKMEITLGEHGARLDAIYYCPHHPEKGFKGEIKKLKINCSCRKPEIGLIKKAAEDFTIDLKKSFFIGDSSVDAKTAENAGIAFVGVKTGLSMKDGKYSVNKKFPLYKNVLEAVNHILK
jgi:histidinol-phosphate phosphatase family protein